MASREGEGEPRQSDEPEQVKETRELTQEEKDLVYSVIRKKGWVIEESGKHIDLTPEEIEIRVEAMKTFLDSTSNKSIIDGIIGDATRVEVKVHGSDTPSITPGDFNHIEAAISVGLEKIEMKEEIKNEKVSQIIKRAKALGIKFDEELLRDYLMKPNNDYIIDALFRANDSDLQLLTEFTDLADADKFLREVDKFTEPFADVIKALDELDKKLIKWINIWKMK